MPTLRLILALQAPVHSLRLRGIIPLLVTALGCGLPGVLGDEAALVKFYNATNGDDWVYSYPMNWCG